jgi:hypothetical protein
MEPIIIIGMHRSGTSMLADLLNHCGVFIGKDIDNNNESLFFRNLNRWMFLQAGASWDNPENFNYIDEIFIKDLSYNIKKHIYGVKSYKFHNNIKKLINSPTPWGWKDPLNTFTSEIWRQIFPQSRFIHIYRNPIDVAESLRNREAIFQKLRDTKTRTGFKKRISEFNLSSKMLYTQSLRVKHIQEGIKLWNIYTEKALSFENCLHIKFESLIDYPQREINHILEYLNIENTQDIVDDISKSIKSDRSNAFLKNNMLVEQYRKIQNSKLLIRLNYHHLSE